MSILRKTQPTIRKKVNCYLLSFTHFINKPISLSDQQFTFLNLSQIFNYNKIDWNFDKNGKLWGYNLNYMDYLLQEGLDKKQGIDLIRLFVKQFNDNSNGKEPYPISLRGINWIKFLSRNKIDAPDINKSLFDQYQVLFNSLEYHLLGNHLLENAFSLLFGGFFFNHIVLYNKAKQILEKELKEQILSDGGHFELSPMYHQIILDRLLDSINLIKNNQRFDNQNELLVFLETKANDMLFWLNQMTLSNGDIPHFNDSTFDIAPTTKQLFDYAERLNLKPNLKLVLSTSGYRKFKIKNYECIVDIGALGPNYIPGHAHADMLSFVLYIDNKPVIIDPGISTYEKNNQRQLERSTCSHNTAIIGGKNQSDVWGGFRVGKRAKISVVQDKASIIEAEHNGYKPVIHKRLFEFIQSGVLIIDVLSKPMDKTHAFFHFHPDRKVGVYGSTILIDDKYSLVFKAMTDINLEVYNCPQGYNKYSKAKRCKVTFQSTMQTQINTYEN